MLGSAQRLSREQFWTVFRTGRVIQTPHFLLRVVSKEANASRGSVVVSKKIAKKAVARHRIRRRVYSALRGLFLEESKLVDVIVVVKKGAPSMSFHDIQKELRAIFTEI